MPPDKPIDCHPCVRQVTASVSLESLSERIAQKSNPAILGGNPSVQGFSLFAAEPLELFEFRLEQDSPFEKLSAVLSNYQSPPAAPGLFAGGWIGFFGYELGRFIETLPARAVNDLSFPVIRLAFYDKAIVYDHTAAQFYLTALDIEGHRQTAQEKLDLLQTWLIEAQNVPVPSFAKMDFAPLLPESFNSNFTQTRYLDAVSAINRYIREGDTYQINLSQRFKTPFAGRPIDVFHWQNRFNPSPYAAFLQWGDKAVISASPELFLKVEGDTIVTKPIKGTRPRNPLQSDDAPDNKQNFHALVESQKDQAELAMIVDLERNDLARVCVPGTRRVTCPRMIEAFPTVYHAAGVIEGTLRLPPGPARIVGILKAAFPGGSITGAPKIRSMEIIDELEPTARSVYTGAIGWISPDFNLCWNIAIRTILIERQTAFVQAGGGIVADSDPLAEWHETLAKARALLAGLSAVNAAATPSTGAAPAQGPSGPYRPL
jgi:para-aminobenzoate synthetase component 1